MATAAMAAAAMYCREVGEEVATAAMTAARMATMMEVAMALGTLTLADEGQGM